MEESLLTSVGLPLALGIIMLGMGLTLVPEDFKRVLKYPGPVLLGLGNQMLLLPIIGFLVASGFPLMPDHAVGIMILAACPGGVTSNLFCHLSRGNTALSITLTAISSALSVMTVPLIVNFALGHFLPPGAGAGGEVQLPVLKTIGQIFVITVLPVGLGMMIRQYKPTLSHKSERPVRILSTVLLIAIIAAVILKNRHTVVDSFISAGPASLALNLASMALGFLSARILLSDIRMGVSISIESGIQNGTLGIVIATTMLESPQMSIPPAIYSLVMFGTGFAAVVLFGRMVKSHQLKHPPAGASGS
ncbi:MAG: bile acid:sodium symporter [Spirochaetaceae bacterium]|nr:bile acid:sodium symporter [Spirochaetaceae bacterium]|tara:strand:- start:518 stop:1432 length:915 start_codon:yes stop_codon:yes gene_type:complete